jgi:uncharacterized FAD-dependent dehydrogenase
MTLRVGELKLHPGQDESELAELIGRRLGCPTTDIVRWRILRKSLDARRRDDIHHVYSVAVEAPEWEKTTDTLVRMPTGVAPLPDSPFEWPKAGPLPLRHRPVVVGSGPAGLFAAYMLAISGYRPIMIERGKDVKRRVADVRAFDAGGPIDSESNYLFGEGGAGTFSDGKLTCRNTGPDVTRVLELLAESHGKPEIVYEHRPHLGSNRLPLIVRTLRRKMEAAGGESRFDCRMEDLSIDDGRVVGVATSSGYIETDTVVLAIGHSARDTYEVLLNKGVPLEFKPFQMGVRIEQPQAAVNRARYGDASETLGLGAADYNLSVHAGPRDLFTFCMCAGGYVMASVSEPEHFCTNGMSESYHDSPFANSGLVMTVSAEDVGSDHPLAGIAYQRRAESAAFRLSGTYQAPAHRAADFLRHRRSKGAIETSAPLGAFAASLADFLPPVILKTLERGLPIMDRSLRGAFLKDAVLVGPETRGSSPVKIPRDNDTRQCPTIAGLYPCGEGAGYAGGIVSAAADGLRSARAVVAAFAPPK